MVLRVPDIREQKRIGQILAAMEEDLKTTIEAASALRTQKRGLMQKLLRVNGGWGEVRMKILGFRSDPSTPRYAIVDSSVTPPALLNADGESRLRFPADCTSEAAQVTWLYREFERIFHIHPDIDRVVIKKGEFTQGDNNAKRVASYQEAPCSCTAACITSRWCRRSTLRCRPEVRR